MADHPEFDRHEQEQATRMSANMPASVQAEVMKHPTGSVARLLVENGGSAAAFYEDAARLPGVPFDIQQLAKQQMAAIDAANEAANRHDARLAASVVGEEMFAENMRRNGEISKARAEDANSQQESAAERQKTEQERQMQSVEKLSTMSYEDWSHHSREEKHQYHEDVKDVQRQNEVRADVLSEGLEQEFLAQHGDTPETRKRWEAIRKGVWNTGADKQDAYRANLSPEDQKYFDRLDNVTSALLSEVVVSGQRVNSTAEQDHHDYQAVTSAAQDARTSAERLQEEAARQGAGSPEVRQQAFEASDTAFTTIRSTPSAQAASTADAAVTENVIARKAVSDQISMTEFKAKTKLGEQAMQDDYGDAPALAGNSPPSNSAAAVDVAASPNPADNTNDLGPLHRAQALMAALDDTSPAGPTRRPPTPASRAPMG